MHQAPHLLKWKGPATSPVPITGYHVRCYDTATPPNKLTEVVLALVPPDPNGFLLCPLDGTGGPLGIQVPVGPTFVLTVASTSASDGESSEVSTGPLTAADLPDAPTAPFGLTVE
jgi:hypothetical protein